MDIFKIVNIIMFLFVIVFCTLVFMRFYVKPYKKYKASNNGKLLYTSIVKNSVFHILLIGFCGLGIFLSVAKNRDISDSLYLGLFSVQFLRIKGSGYVLTEKEIYYDRQIINIEDIVAIKKNYKAVWRTSDITLKEGKEVSVRTSKKALNALKQFCELNRIEYSEASLKEE